MIVAALAVLAVATISIAMAAGRPGFPASAPTASLAPAAPTAPAAPLAPAQPSVTPSPTATQLPGPSSTIPAATLSPTPTHTGTSTSTPTASPSPTSYRVADLGVDASDDRDPVPPGEVFHYIVDVDNYGPNMLVLGATVFGGIQMSESVRFTGNITGTEGLLAGCEPPTEDRFRCSYYGMSPMFSPGVLYLEATTDRGSPPRIAQFCAGVDYGPPLGGGHDPVPGNDVDCEETVIWDGSGQPPQTTPSATPTNTPTASATPTPSPTPSCDTHTTSASLHASSERLGVGDVVTVTARIENVGCASIGLLSYRLSWDGDSGGDVFDSPSPVGVEHSIGVGPGGGDAAEFVLHAVRPGVASLSVLVTFEVHLGYPGPAYFASDGAGPLEVAVDPGRAAIMVPVAYRRHSRE